MRIELTVNGRRLTADDVWEGESLLYVLRERLGLPGSKNACEQGECGSCTVRLDGVPVCSCLVAAGQAEGRDVITVEGLAALARRRAERAAAPPGPGDGDGPAAVPETYDATPETDDTAAVPEAYDGTPGTSGTAPAAPGAVPGAPGQDLAPIQRAFVEAGAVQCGFCTPGLLVAADELLERRPDPSDSDIREALAGNLCRCTGYEKILDAVRLAAARRPTGEGTPR
ncbi:(2Fe-2S)-binding protein [Streptomyces sp. NPDC020875]|uniref:(2Fe-2S)-binding protein n=1 Tax=Streptomyces sp. NPDC020875 TaxID=3154898 RepID=UPI0033F6A356